MNSRTLLLAGAIIASAFCLGNFMTSGRTVSAGDEKAAAEKPDFTYKQPSPEQMQEMMKTYMETTKPSKYHKWFEQLVGEWETTSSMWTSGPDKPPTKSKGSATIGWAVPGKWLRQEWKGSMMGMPMHGFGIAGYDNFKKKFVGSWFDNMGTAMLTYEGLLDRTGTVLNQWGRMDEPITGEHDKAVRYTTRIVDENKFTFEIHDLAIGEDQTKVIEMEYTRKK